VSRVELTGIARIALLLLEHAEEYGLDGEELARHADLSRLDLSDPDTRIPVSAIESLWRTVIERLPDEADLGLRLGQTGQLREMGLVGYAMLHSSTLGEAFERLERYIRIISEAIQMRFERGEQHSSVVLNGPPSLDVLRHPAESRLAIMLSAARQMTGREIVPLEALFSHPRPASVAEHVRFFRAPLEFGRPNTALIFRNTDLELSVATADETLSGYLDRLAEETLEGLGSEASFLARVQRAIWIELSGGHPTLERTARELGVSARTLQRRLTEAGTSFTRLLERVRREMAFRLLRNRSLAVYEVAFLLGYSEPSTFYRAFRRWAGASPVEYRHRESTS